MFDKDHSAVQILNANIQIDGVPVIRSAKLVHVDGKGALTTHSYLARNAKGTFDYLTQITLNHVPLLEINAPEYSTFKRILTAGHGIANANCRELNDLQERINEPFTSLEDSIETLEPLLELLDTGLYLIADALCYPTDGDGHFFWNLPCDPAGSPAMEPILLKDRVHPYIWGHPAFLYPTENAECYDEDRVRHYIDVYGKSDNTPRALVYNFGQFISFLLDGHHKACAAALLKRPVKCLVIIPFSRYGYMDKRNRATRDALCFGAVSVPVDAIPVEYMPVQRHEESSSYSALCAKIRNRSWEERYIRTASVFPSVYEYADMTAAKIPDGVSVNEELIRSCLDNPDPENQQILKAILFAMELREDPARKALAIACAGQLPSGMLKKQAFRVLAGIAGDPEIEQIFVDYLVGCEDPDDVLLPIINSYWE